MEHQSCGCGLNGKIYKYVSQIKILQHTAFEIAITRIIASISFEIGTAHGKKDDDTEKPNFEILCCFFCQRNMTLVISMLFLLLPCMFNLALFLFLLLIAFEIFIWCDSILVAWGCLGRCGFVCIKLSIECIYITYM